MVSSIWDSCSKINHYDLKTALVNKPLWRGALHHEIFGVTFTYNPISMWLWGARNLTFDWFLTGLHKLVAHYLLYCVAALCYYIIE